MCKCFEKITGEGYEKREKIAKIKIKQGREDVS